MAYPKRPAGGNREKTDWLGRWPGNLVFTGIRSRGYDLPGAGARRRAGTCSVLHGQAELSEILRCLRGAVFCLVLAGGNRRSVRRQYAGKYISGSFLYRQRPGAWRVRVRCLFGLSGKGIGGVLAADVSSGCRRFDSAPVAGSKVGRAGNDAVTRCFVQYGSQRSFSRKNPITAAPFSVGTDSRRLLQCVGGRCSRIVCPGITLSRPIRVPTLTVIDLPAPAYTRPWTGGRIPLPVSAFPG